MNTIGYINVSLETFGGLLSLIFMISLYFARTKNERMEQLYIRLLVCNTALLFSDATAWLFKGKDGSFSFYMVRISNFLVFTLGYVFLLLFTHYFISYMKIKDSKITRLPLYFMGGLTLLAICMVIVSQFNGMYYSIDEQNVYHRQHWFWFSQALGIIGMFFNIALLFRFRKVLAGKELLSFGTYICLPMLALLLQILFYGIAVLYLATTICLLCIYINIQIGISQKASQKELELEIAKTDIMLSQIQPHFLYNTLTAICGLCDENPKDAKQVTADFADYLRHNLDSLGRATPIPFDRELRHVEVYLSIEKRRFEEKLNVVYDITTTDFMLPALSVQPLVENAVKHSISVSADGGTVTISTREHSDCFEIIIADDGVGFAPNAPYQDNRRHIGIANVEKRLWSICGATLEIESSPGSGTRATIHLPKEGEQC